MEVEDPINSIDFETDILDESMKITPTRIEEIKLRVGMDFENIEAVTHAYAHYAMINGFQIRRRNSRPKMVQFVCYREGFTKSQSKKLVEGDTTIAQCSRFTKTCRSGCRACLYVVLDSSTNGWRVSKFFDQHNHEMVSPKSRKYLRAYKKLSNSAKCLTEVFESERIGIGKVMNVLNPNPDEVEFTKKDCYNYMTKIRKKILDVGDAQAVHAFCIRQQELNPNFRYSIQLDEEDRMMNFFWVDSRSRMAYHIFGDVVSFDTTYKTNKYSMSFAPFVGIDNHMHTILFGCALLQDESEETFIWLFKSWLYAMDDKVSISFVTDQDMAMMNAVGKVFPTARHRLCLWHIKKKFPERLSHIYHDHSSFKGEINKCIHDSLSIELFESTWMRLVSDYNLGGNDWFRNLFEMREIWVPIFCKDVFFGGLNTTGRSERINSFFDTFVHFGTTLKEFVHKYSQALENRYETFRRSEFDSRHKTPILSIGMTMEEHAGSIYTSEVFKLFHVELKSSLLFRRELLFEGESLHTYRVTCSKNKSDSVKVEYNIRDHDANCECRTFQFKGFLCRHILVVLHMHNIDFIPAQYILARWTKDIGRVLWESPIARESTTPTSLRMFELKAIFDDICIKCETSDSAYEYVKKAVDGLYVGLKTHLDGLPQDFVGSSNPLLCSQHSAHHSSYNMRNPNVTHTKGRIKNSSIRAGRITSGIEIASDSTIRCSACFTVDHNRRTCPKVREYE